MIVADKYTRLIFSFTRLSKQYVPVSDGISPCLNPSESDSGPDPPSDSSEEHLTSSQRDIHHSQLVEHQTPSHNISNDCTMYMLVLLTTVKI